MNYLSVRETGSKMLDIYEKGQQRGISTGFRCLDDLYTIKPGCTTYIIGTPTHGKTEFLFELLLNSTAGENWKHALFTPESGNEVDISIELVKKQTKKRFDKRWEKTPGGRMNEKEMFAALGWLGEFFWILKQDQERPMSVDECLSIALKIKQEHGLNTLSIDPWNELDCDFSQHGGREDKYLEFTLGKIRRFARENNIHVFIVAHPRTLRPNKDGQYDAPHAYDISGGAPWYAKAESIICINRPTVNSSEANIIVQKAKPKIVGTKGIVSLFYDVKSQRYYEQDRSGRMFFAHGEEAVNIYPQTEQNGQEIDGLPF